MSAEFPRSSRITRGPELQRVLKEGKRIRTRNIDVRCCASPLCHSGGRRIGIIVPKAKHSAVERNQLKRRLRELARHHLLPGSSGDVVILTRPESYVATYEMLTADIVRAAHMLQRALNTETEIR